MPINWEEAPEGTTHHISYRGGPVCWWIWVTGPNSYKYWKVNVVANRWYDGALGQSLEQLCEENGYICEERPKEKAMLTVKDIRHTRAYQQLKDFINLNVQNVKRRPYELGVLTKRYLHGLNNGGRLEVSKHMDVCDSFTWAETPEKHEFWEFVHHNARLLNLHPCPVGDGEAKAVAKKLVPKVPAPAKRLGWW